MNILITSAGQRVSLVRAFQVELSKYYPKAKVLTTDMNPSLSPACQVSDGYFEVKQVTHPDYIPYLLELCQQHDIHMIVPTIDTELLVLAGHRTKFSNYGIHVIISSPEFVQKCRDKRKVNKFFQTREIDIPGAIDKANPTFPLFIKPYDGSRSEDTFLIKSPEELTSYHLSNKKLMFMEYINRDEYDEYTIDMYYGRDNRVKCIVPRKRIAVRAGEINKGKTCYNEIVPYLKGRMSYIRGVVGCLTTQVFLSKKSSHIVAIEINPRFGGGYPLSYQAGANYPRYLIQEYFRNETIDYMETWERNLLMLRYDDEVLIHEKTIEQLVSDSDFGGEREKE